MSDNEKKSRPAPVDWRGADLRRVNMAGISLEQADLRACDLRGVNFTGSSLRYADLRGARLQGASFQNASLYGAKMQGAEAQQTDFRGADLRQANLGGAYLEGAVMPPPSAPEVRQTPGEISIDRGADGQQPGNGQDKGAEHEPGPDEGRGR
jgi:uncharacterized protein YjbI with pentapeptide repeats